MSNLNDPERVQIFEAALELLKGSSEDNPVNTWNLVQKIKDKTDIPKTERNIYYVLLSLSQEIGSGIFSKRGSKGGYYLGEDKTEDLKASDEEDLKKEKTRERHLYPIVAEWLATEKNLRAFEISSKRVGGLWANPDLVCVSEIDVVGIKEVETYAIEVKLSLYKWKMYFFQAVAYKEIANMSYFFYMKDRHRDKERDEIVRTAIRHGIGVVEMEFDDSDFGKINRFSSMDYGDQLVLIGKIVERVRPRFSAVSAVDKAGLLARCGRLLARMEE